MTPLVFSKTLNLEMPFRHNFLYRKWRSNIGYLCFPDPVPGPFPRTPVLNFHLPAQALNLFLADLVLNLRVPIFRLSVKVYM